MEDPSELTAADVKSVGDRFGINMQRDQLDGLKKIYGQFLETIIPTGECHVQHSVCCALCRIGWPGLGLAGCIIARVPANQLQQFHVYEHQCVCWGHTCWARVVLAELLAGSQVLCQLLCTVCKPRVPSRLLAAATTSCLIPAGHACDPRQGTSPAHVSFMPVTHAAPDPAPAGNEQLKGDEAGKVKAMKEALELTDEDAAPVHMEVGRRWAVALLVGLLGQLGLCCEHDTDAADTCVARQAGGS